MKKYQIQSQNLNNSLVFYRHLFDKMPDDFGIDYIKFITDKLHLEIREGVSGAIQNLMLEVNEEAELKKISKRMRRFRSLERFKENCSEVGQTIGLIDPDGHRWKIGDPASEPDYEKCYVTL